MPRTRHVRDPEKGVIGGPPRGKVTRFVQIGTTGLLLCAIVIVLAVAMAISLHLAVLAAAVVFILLCAILVSTLTIEVDDRGVFWCFTGGLFSRRVDYAEIGAYEATRYEGVSIGYRIWFNKRAWIVNGRKAVAFQLRDSAMQYVVGCDDPEAVCAEIARRNASADADRLHI